MQFKKGQSGNPSGRPKGIVSQTPSQIREALRNIIAGHVENLENDLRKMEPEKKWNLLRGLLPYAVPRLNSIEISPENSLLELLHLPTERLKEGL